MHGGKERTCKQQQDPYGYQIVTDPDNISGGCHKK
jgi:hypothetical protein